ncbi:MAG: DUF4160 domain-containing protein [Planctomycetes bacterium]|nr:DUF4160 domain-containing protein [Planctomycetota bacterium]MBI3846550.1 DUF4160 domain-containing protein [Planctomycetota bacterium]
MPKICEFRGIVIRMYFDEHRPPHFHAEYGEFAAQIAIGSGNVMNGKIPPRIFRLVTRWAGLHRSELLANWNRARSRAPLKPIEPLR